VERCPGGALCEQREHHVAAVAVREPLVRRELGLEPVKRSEVVLGGSELVDGDGRHVVEGFVHDLIVVVVAMPDRCASGCSTVTASSIRGRSSPSTERAVVVRVSRSSSIRLMTVRAVSPLAPLAIPKRVSTSFAISQPRCANP
jgi:hypothetical protein